MSVSHSTTTTTAAVKEVRRSQRTYKFRELNDSFKAMVKPECQDMSFPMAWTRIECLKLVVEEKMGKVNH